MRPIFTGPLRRMTVGLTGPQKQSSLPQKTGLAMKQASCSSILLLGHGSTPMEILEPVPFLKEFITMTKETPTPSKYVLLYLISFILRETWKSLSPAMHP